MDIYSAKLNSGFDPQPMIDRRVFPTYGAIGLGVILSFTFVAALGFTLTPAALAIFWSWPLLAVGGMLARRIGHAQIAAAMEGTALLYGQGLSTMLLLFTLAALSGPYVDPLLAQWDAAIGFHWPRYVELTAPFAAPLIFAYRSFAWQPLLLVVILVSSRQSGRLWVLTLAAALACLITAAIFPFFPGEGVFLHYGIGLGDFPTLGKRSAWEFTSVMEYLRNGGRVIDPAMFTGLVSFPSYHAAEALQFAWAGWTVRWFRWPLVALNVVVILSTPIVGAHYAVDVIAGLAVGAVAIYLAKVILERVGVRPLPGADNASTESTKSELENSPAGIA